MGYEVFNDKKVDSKKTKVLYNSMFNEKRKKAIAYILIILGILLIGLKITVKYIPTINSIYDAIEHHEVSRYSEFDYFKKNDEVIVVVYKQDEYIFNKYNLKTDEIIYDYDLNDMGNYETSISYHQFLLDQNWIKQSNFFAINAWDISLATGIIFILLALAIFLTSDKTPEERKEEAIRVEDTRAKVEQMTITVRRGGGSGW